MKKESLSIERLFYVGVKMLYQLNLRQRIATTGLLCPPSHGQHHISQLKILIGKTPNQRM
jgi:hypothetical protein